MSWYICWGWTIRDWHDAWKQFRQRLMHFTLCRWYFENSVCWCSKREIQWDRCKCKASNSPTPWSVAPITFVSHALFFSLDLFTLNLILSSFPTFELVLNVFFPLSEVSKEYFYFYFYLFLIFWNLFFLLPGSVSPLMIYFCWWKIEVWVHIH